MKELSDKEQNSRPAPAHRGLRIMRGRRKIKAWTGKYLSTPARQGLANTIYRSVNAGAGIVAPLAATVAAAAAGGYPPIFLLLALLVLMAAWTLARYPDDVVHPPWRSLAEEARRLWLGYAGALRERRLMQFMHLSLFCASALAGVSAFAAIRFTRELELTDSQFGLLSTMAGLLIFILILSAAWFLDRISLRILHVGTGLIAAAGSCVMGASNHLWISIGGFLVTVSMTAVIVGPSSMWVSRIAGAATQTAAFSVYNVLSALYFAGA